MKLFIKNMVCNRCKAAVQSCMEQLGLQTASVELGEVELTEDKLAPGLLREIRAHLALAGFELLDTKNARIVEKIKNLTVAMVHYGDGRPRQKYSEWIAAEMHHDYPYLSKLFSETEGITIEQYIIQQKVEKIKEYLAYDELNLKEIAGRMGYSSAAHLSAQFKKITGLPPSHFKNTGLQRRKPIDKVGAHG